MKAPTFIFSIFFTFTSAGSAANVAAPNNGKESPSQSQSSDKSSEKGQEQKLPADNKDEKTAPQEPPQDGGSSNGLIIL